MSALGQTFAHVGVMSALPPKADMEQRGRNVRFVPKADSCSAAKGLLFDYFVDTAKQGNRHCDAECLRCLEVDNELDFRCLLDWQVGRFFTPENTARINAGEPI
jgi:hypothetical protein